MRVLLPIELNKKAFGWISNKRAFANESLFPALQTPGVHALRFSVLIEQMLKNSLALLIASIFIKTLHLNSHCRPTSFNLQ